MEEDRKKAYLSISSLDDVELLRRTRKESVVLSVRINERLLRLVDEKLEYLRRLGVKMSRADLINLLLLQFVKAEINVETIPIRVDMNINIIATQNNIYKNGRVYTTPHDTTPHNNDKYSEVKSLIRKAESLKMALSHTKEDSRKQLLYAKIEEIVGLILEKLAGDESEKAKRYRRRALFILEGIKGLLKEV